MSALMISPQLANAEVISPPRKTTIFLISIFSFSLRLHTVYKLSSFHAVVHYNMQHIRILHMHVACMHASTRGGDMIRPWRTHTRARAFLAIHLLLSWAWLPQLQYRVRTAI